MAKKKKTKTQQEARKGWLNAAQKSKYASPDNAAFLPVSLRGKKKPASKEEGRVGH